MPALRFWALVIIFHLPMYLQSYRKIMLPEHASLWRQVLALAIT